MIFPALPPLEQVIPIVGIVTTSHGCTYDVHHLVVGMCCSKRGPNAALVDRIGLGLKVGVPKVNFKGGWDCILCIPDQSQIIPKLYGSESRHSQYTDPIVAQPAQLQSCENNHRIVA